MNGLQGRKVQKIESPIPGCLGRMVNLFDLGTSGSGKKLLTDKPHRYGSSLSRNRSDVAQMPAPSYREGEMVTSDLRSASDNVDCTPMKRLIAREMSKEVEHKQNPTNVVAKLMGLDNLPQLQLDNTAQRSRFNSYSRCSLNKSGIHVDHQAQSCQEHSRFKDVYVMRRPPQKMNCSRDISRSPRKGRLDESMTEQMALVRQKFMEAKRLVTDEKLHQSKEFQDALEVLSCNKDLFVKFLQESNSFFSHHFSEFQPVPLQLDAKRITVLRPSKVVNTEKFVVQDRNAQAKRSASSVQGIGWDNSKPGFSSSVVNRRAEEPAQPTRIVVLKPSPVKAPDIKAVALSSPSSPGGLHCGDFFDEPGDVESREVAKEMTRQIRENLMGYRRDETDFSSVLSNGYIGHDSSFDKTDNEYPAGNLTDSEMMSPRSRHSWDGINRFGSPFSPSSFSRASFSPESSVCREAKKRLSERWASLSSHGSIQQQNHVPRTSSTLGEMLALSDVKAPPAEATEDERIETKLVARVSTSCISSELNQEENASSSPKELARSKSVPVSLTASGIRFNVETAVPETSKAEAPRESTETRSLKSSWKVSNLFSFKYKKSRNEKFDASSQTSCESQTAAPPVPYPVNLIGKTSNDGFPSGSGVSLEECLSPDALPQQNICPREEDLATAKPLMAGNSSENQDQPSPISVLQPPFEEDDSGTQECPELTQPQNRGLEMSLKSNLIDKSPLIGSIARTLSWDDSCTDLTKPSSGIDEDQDWYVYINMLLTDAGLNGNVYLDSLLARQHSVESPLDPLLIDKYANLSSKDLIYDAKCRHQRSNRKLIFDCANSALAEVMRAQALHCPGSNKSLMDSTQPLNLVDYVWTQLKDWLSSEAIYDPFEAVDINSLAAERVVRDEVVGRTWFDTLRIELDSLGIEIEVKLLQELVEEAVLDLTR